MVETNIEIKVEVEYPEDLNIVKETGGEMMMSQRRSAPVHVVRIGMNMKKDLMKYTGNEEIEPAITEITVCEDIAFCPGTC